MLNAFSHYGEDRDWLIAHLEYLTRSVTDSLFFYFLFLIAFGLCVILLSSYIARR